MNIIKKYKVIKNISFAINFIRNKIKKNYLENIHLTNPLIIEQNSEILHILKIKEVEKKNTNKSFMFQSNTYIEKNVVISKETLNKNLEVKSQLDIISTLYEKLPTNIRKLEQHSEMSKSQIILCMIRQEASKISLTSQRGYGNKIIISHNLYEIIKKDLSHDKDKIDCSDYYNYVGYIGYGYNGIISIYVAKDKKLIPNNNYIMSYSNPSIDGGIFISNINNKSYLTFIEPYDYYNKSYKDFFKIISIMR